MHHHSHVVLDLCEVAFPYSQFLHTGMAPPQMNVDWWSTRSQWSTKAMIWKFAANYWWCTLTIGTGDLHLWTCVKMSGGYITVSSSGFAVRALVLAIWTLVLEMMVRSRHSILTSSSFSIHSLVQRRRVYPHLVRWFSRDHISPTQPHPLSLLLHMTWYPAYLCILEEFQKDVMQYVIKFWIHSSLMSGKPFR